jgi:hypothetical protein
MQREQGNKERIPILDKMVSKIHNEIGTNSNLYGPPLNRSFLFVVIILRAMQRICHHPSSDAAVSFSSEK